MCFTWSTICSTASSERSRSDSFRMASTISYNCLIHKGKKKEVSVTLGFSLSKWKGSTNIVPKQYFVSPVFHAHPLGCFRYLNKSLTGFNTYILHHLCIKWTLVPFFFFCGEYYTTIIYACFLWYRQENWCTIAISTEG